MQKKQERPPKSSKNKMFNLGLRSTSDDWPSNPSDEHQPKGPLSHHKMKCLFSDGLPEDCQKTTRRPPEDLWQSSNIMIQGNFYERSHFYMDSCAISPTASLFKFSWNFGST